MAHITTASFDFSPCEQSQELKRLAATRSKIKVPTDYALLKGVVAVPKSATSYLSHNNTRQITKLPSGSVMRPSRNAPIADAILYGLIGTAAALALLLVVLSYGAQ
jgi:hypothetical protein